VLLLVRVLLVQGAPAEHMLSRGAGMGVVRHQLLQCRVCVCVCVCVRARVCVCACVCVLV